MVQRSVPFSVIVTIVLCLTSGSLLAQKEAYPALAESLAKQYNAVQYKGTADVGSLNELHNWFAREVSNLAIERYNGDYRVVPLGIYRTTGLATPHKESRWNYGAEYHFPLNTINGFFTLFSGKYGSARTWLRLFYGAGVDTVQNLDSEIASNWGVNGEVGFYTDKLYINPLLGITYLWVDPKEGADGQGNYLYVGNRIFLTSGKSLSVDVRGGVAMWRDFDDEDVADEDPPGWFGSVGLTVHRDVDLSDIGGLRFAYPEVGIYSNPSLETLDSKLLAPVRVRRGLSFAPFVTYGLDVGGQDLSALYGLGAELRLFGEEIYPVSDIYPYIGFQHYWLNYEGISDNGNGNSFYFGARLYLNEQLAIDGNFGPVFWADDYPVEKPEDWAGHIGLCASFGRAGEARRLRGSILTTDRDWGKAPISGTFDTLDERGLHMWDGEVRVFAIEQCKPDTFMKPFGDLTDLKFFSVDLAVQLDMQPLNTKAKLLNPSRQKEREVFIIILFNSKHTRVNELKSSNTFFHFADLENSQYFGYRWDANHSRQPEYRNFDSLGAHEGIAGNIYWGAYSEFVKPVMWLDAGKVMRLLEGKDVEQLIMDDMNKQLSQDELYQNAATPEQKLAVIQANYRIAYVQYPESEIDKILEFLPIEKIGVAVMVGYDKDLDGLYVPVKDARWQNGKTPEGADPAAVAAFDKDDSFFFSNHVVLEDVLARDVTLDGFDECEVTLKDEHRRILNEKVIPRLLENPDAKVKLIGYTDATPMSEDCIKSYGNGNQVGLANARAQSVQNYLVYCGGIAKDRLPIEARGILLPRHEHEPKDRCVIIRFIR